MHRCRGDRSQPPIVPRTSDSQPEPSQPRPDLAPRHLQDPYPRGTTAQLPSGLTPAWQYTPTSDPNDPALQANDEPPPPSQALPGSTRRGHRYESPGRHGSPYRHDSSRGATRADRLGDWPQALSTAQPNQSASLSPQPQPVRAIPSAPSGYHQASQQRQPFPVTLTGSLQQLTPTPPGHLPPTPSRGQLPYLPNQRPLRSHDPAQMPTSSSSHHQTPSRPQMSSELLPPPPARRPAAAVQQQQAHNDPALDFFSEHFDALKALQTRGLQPPVPRVKPLDNITRCRMILPPELPDSSSAWAASHPKAEPTQEAVRNKELSKSRTAAVMKRELDQAAKGNTLDKIAHKFTSGPLLLLRRYYRTSVRLQVATRHASGIRGIATGYLHGFDKFMNLVLMNVDEDYTVMVRVPHDYTVTVHAPAEPQPADQGGPLVMVEHQVNKFRWKRKAEKRKRRLHQVFLRGDNIVTIEPVLQDVQKHWAQLVLQWASAGIPESAFAVPPQLGVPSHSRAASLPTEAAQPAAVASHSAAVAQLTPAWAHNKR